MGEFTDKAKGIANEVAGKVKQAVGGDGHDPKLEAEGAAQEDKGHVQQAKGDVKGAVKDVVDRA